MLKRRAREVRKRGNKRKEGGKKEVKRKIEEQEK